MLFHNFQETLKKENADAIEKYNAQFSRWSGERIVEGNLPLYYYENGLGNPNIASVIKLNGATFKEEANKRINKQTVGSGSINKQYFFVQDTWQLNRNALGRQHGTYDGHLLEKPMRCKEVFDLLWGNILTIGSLVEIFQTLRKKEGTPF